ncbi:unnamed protein product [Schistosoma turkestanicum]|nr:unnamed protein product [Schistosoma turkestanicum]
MSFSNELQSDDISEECVEFSLYKQKYSSSLLSRSKVSSEINEPLSLSSQKIIRRYVKKNVKKPNHHQLRSTFSDIDWTNSYNKEFDRLFTNTITSNEDVMMKIDYVENWINVQPIINPITNISNSNHLLSRLINYAIDGQLRVSHFRSICWRIFLDILPNDINQWSKQLKKDREYFTMLNCQININPHTNYIKSDDHPLSDSRTSLWNKYFYSLKVKRSIAKDVCRTFPNVEYFHNQNIHNIMIDLLYIYTENENISYQQGMHEILAPLLFVLHCDLTAFEHVVEMKIISSDLWNHLKYIMNKEYFQADVYIMFAKIMNSVKNWYPQIKLSNNININNNNDKRIRRRTVIGLPTTITALKSQTSSNKQQNSNSNSQGQTQLMVTNKMQKNITNNKNRNDCKYFKIYYGDDSDESSGTDHEEIENNSWEVIEKYEQNKDESKQCDYGNQYTFHFDQEEHVKHNCSGDCFVEQIHQQLLLRHNPLLYAHLRRLEISPKLFGLKWIRLLFGHEFPLQDLLYIWDCIFAINNNLAFVPYMYLSMLLRLAPSLIKYEFTECLTLLMNYPTDIDVTCLIHSALHFYKPHLYNKSLNVQDYYSICDNITIDDDNDNKNDNAANSKTNDISINTSCSSNDMNTTNYDEKDSDIENIDKTNNSINRYNASNNYAKRNTISYLPYLSDKIKSKFKNTLFRNLSKNYPKTTNMNNLITITNLIRRSMTFKNSKQLMSIPRGRSLANFPYLKKSLQIKWNEENIQLSNIMTSTENTNNSDNNNNNRTVQSSYNLMSLNVEDIEDNNDSDGSKASLF